jgi:predicted dehydrogenase
MSGNARASKHQITRRDFIVTSALAGAGILTAASPLAKTVSAFSTKKRYAIVGVGHRTQVWQDGIYDLFSDTCEVVGFCDTNKGRAQFYQHYAKKKTGRTVPIYDAREFDTMIKETKPETVIVTTIDGIHHRYIIRAMELGCDVITEKPMTTDERKCQQIIDAQKKYGRTIRVGFNYRYSPARTQVKELLMNGEIGDILSVDFHWMLNTHHGTDYFRRWHSQKKYSGGLMLHKATHHFDLVNWWLSVVPVTVYANGKREFYTPAMIKRFGLDTYHERCHTCPERAKCAFELDLEKNARLKALYLDNEQYDGYFRDRCVFRPDIDIEDTMNVVVKYSNNATLSYSLNAFNAWEGYYIAFNGTKGRLEHRIEEKIYVAGDGREQGGVKEGGTTTKIFPLRGNARNIEVWTGEGGHGGGDTLMLKDIFLDRDYVDKYMRAADQRAGAYSLLTGAAANVSMKTGSPVKITSLVQGIGMPDFPAMPAHDEDVPMPDKNIG